MTAEPTWEGFRAHQRETIARIDTDPMQECARDLSNALVFAKNRVHELEVALDWARSELAEAKASVSHLEFLSSRMEWDAARSRGLSPEQYRARIVNTVKEAS